MNGQCANCLQHNRPDCNLKYMHGYIAVGRQESPRKFPLDCRAVVTNTSSAFALDVSIVVLALVFLLDFALSKAALLIARSATGLRWLQSRPFAPGIGLSDRWESRPPISGS